MTTVDIKFVILISGFDMAGKNIILNSWLKDFMIKYSVKITFLVAKITFLLTMLIESKNNQLKS